MNATWTLDLFPNRWRARYDQSFRTALTEHPATIADTTDLVLGASLAHLRPTPRQHPRDAFTPQATASPAPPDQAWMIGLWAHIGLYLMVNVILVVINLLTTPGEIWFPYVLWGWGIGLAIHIGLTWPGRNGIRGVPLVALIVIGTLIWTNLMNGGPAWSVWPVWGLLSAMLVFSLHAKGRIGDLGAHVLIVVLASLELIAAGIVVGTSDAWQSIALAMAYATATVVVHGWYHLGNLTLLQAHALLFVLINALLIVDARTDGEQAWWFVFPLAAWSVLLAAHALLARRLHHTPEGAWEQAMLSALASNSDELADNQARLRARRFGFRQHLVLVVIGTAMLVVVNLLTPDAGWWVIWPLSVWIVILAGHGGMLAISRYPNLGIWLFGGGAAAIWIYAIDRSTSGGPWWYWPVGVWAVLTPIMASLNINLLNLIGTPEDDQDSPPIPST